MRKTTSTESSSFLSFFLNNNHWLRSSFQQISFLESASSKLAGTSHHINPGWELSPLKIVMWSWHLQVCSAVFLQSFLKSGYFSWSHDVILLVTFYVLPDTTDDHTLLWLLNHVRLGIPELIMQIRHHRHTRIYAFFVTATYEKYVS